MKKMREIRTVVRLVTVCGLFAALALTAGAATPNAASPYGICFHGIASTNCIESHYRALQYAGIAWGRADFDWRWIEVAPGKYDFPFFDPAIRDAVDSGIQILPILHRGPVFHRPYVRHIGDWRKFVRLFAERYRGVFPVYEIWNEVNGQEEIGNPTNYLAYLEAAGQELKAVDPSVKVAIGGFCGLPVDMIREIYRLGGAKCFDIMNFHHYEFPRPPEECLAAQVKTARDLMEEFGDGDKPIWITETGYAVHYESFMARGWLRKGLEIAFAGRGCGSRIRRLAQVVMDSGYHTGFDREGSAYQASVERLLRSELPPNSAGAAVEFVPAERLSDYLASTPPDVLVYPYAERFPADSFEDVARYVDDGGVLVQAGLMPFGAPQLQDASGRWQRSGSFDCGRAKRLRINAVAPWHGKDVPSQVMTCPVTAHDGVIVPDGGVRAERYLLPFPGHEAEFRPILVSTNVAPSGARYASAAVYKRTNGGALVLSSHAENSENLWTSDRERQAQMLPRSFLTLFASGVEKVFWYTLYTSERDPYDREEWFGIADQKTRGTPYPALIAYRTLIEQRPAGSVGPVRGETWCDSAAGFYHPAWTRPDGTRAGALWTLQRQVKRLRFSTPKVRFVDLYGRPTAPRADLGNGLFSLELGESPVYYYGGNLLSDR